MRVVLAVEQTWDDKWHCWCVLRTYEGVPVAGQIVYDVGSLFGEVLRVEWEMGIPVVWLSEDEITGHGVQLTADMGLVDAEPGDFVRKLIDA